MVTVLSLKKYIYILNLNFQRSLKQLTDQWKVIYPGYFDDHGKKMVEKLAREGSAEN